jgi:hypothetical protein
MAKLSPVELALAPMAAVGLLDVAEDVECFEQTSQGGEGLGQAIGGSPPNEPFQHHIGRGHSA